MFFNLKGQSDKAKFLQLSKSFLNLFGTKADIMDLKIGKTGSSSGLVPISSNYPSILVSPMFSIEMQAIIDDSKKENSFIFRKVIGTIIPDHIEWAKRKGSEMLDDFQNEILAAYGL